MSTSLDALIALVESMPAENLIENKYFDDYSAPMTGCACVVGAAVRMLPDEPRGVAIAEIQRAHDRAAAIGVRVLTKTLEALHAHFSLTPAELSRLQNANDLARDDAERKHDVLLRLRQFKEIRQAETVSST